MNRYLVEFEDTDIPYQVYWADDEIHAKEQAEDAYPDEDIRRIYILEWVWGERK